MERILLSKETLPALLEAGLKNELGAIVGQRLGCWSSYTLDPKTPPTGCAARLIENSGVAKAMLTSNPLTSALFNDATIAVNILDDFSDNTLTATVRVIYRNAEGYADEAKVLTLQAEVMGASLRLIDTW
jgi:hypothetical protein